MPRYINDETKVVVSVADDKAGRFTSGWTSLADGEYEAPVTENGDGGAPKGNASRDEWASYADSLGVEYDEDAKREDIKAAVDAAQK
jgi:hypothetical protein